MRVPARRREVHRRRLLHPGAPSDAGCPTARTGDAPPRATVPRTASRPQPRPSTPRRGCWRRGRASRPRTRLRLRSRLPALRQVWILARGRPASSASEHFRRRKVVNDAVWHPHFAAQSVHGVARSRRGAGRWERVDGSPSRHRLPVQSRPHFAPPAFSAIQCARSRSSRALQASASGPRP